MRPATGTLAGALNGTIAFLSSRAGSSQIWIIDPSGGEAAQVTACPWTWATWKWPPSCSSFLFSMEVYPGLHS